jgi:hypothetical protein
MFFALVVGLGVHFVVTCGVTSLPLLHASEGECLRELLGLCVGCHWRISQCA